MRRRLPKLFPLFFFSHFLTLAAWTAIAGAWRVDVVRR